MSFTRRQFGQAALAGAPAIGALLRGNLAAAAVGQAPPKLSQWAGVQLGLNVPYSLGTGNNIAAEVFAESRAGSRRRLPRAARPAGGALPRIADGPGGGRSREGLSRDETRPPRQRPSRSPVSIRSWRLSAPSSKLKELRQMYETAGVAIDILKVDDLYAISDEETGRLLPDGARPRRASHLGGAAGDRAATRSASARSPTSTRSSWPTTITPRPTAAIYEAPFTEAPLQRGERRHRPLDGATETSPLPFITKHADRIPAHPRQGSPARDQRRREHAVRPGRHRGSSDPAGHPRQQVAHPPDHRVRVSGSGRAPTASPRSRSAWPTAGIRWWPDPRSSDDAASGIPGARTRVIHTTLPSGSARRNSGVPTAAPRWVPGMGTPSRFAFS